MPKTKQENVQDARIALNMSQHDYWAQMGVTQSGGSRYESGRNRPKPLRKLMNLALLPKDEALQQLAELRAPFEAARKEAERARKAAAK